MCVWACGCVGTGCGHGATSSFTAVIKFSLVHGQAPMRACFIFGVRGGLYYPGRLVSESISTCWALLVVSIPACLKFPGDGLWTSGLILRPVCIWRVPLIRLVFRTLLPCLSRTFPAGASPPGAPLTGWILKSPCALPVSFPHGLRLANRGLSLHSLMRVKAFSSKQQKTHTPRPVIGTFRYDAQLTQPVEDVTRSQNA